jgi:hypothetical protein
MRGCDDADADDQAEEGSALGSLMMTAPTSLSACLV